VTEGGVGEKILSWRRTGFNVHSLVRTKTKLEAERVGKYMIRPVRQRPPGEGQEGEPESLSDPVGRGGAPAKPPPSHVFEQVALAAAEGSGEHF